MGYLGLMQQCWEQVPEMIVRNQLSGMVISETSSASRPRQPIKEAEAKRQVQQMIKKYVALGVSAIFSVLCQSVTDAIQNKPHYVDASDG